MLKEFANYFACYFYIIDFSDKDLSKSPPPPGKMQHKVHFQAEYSWFEFWVLASIPVAISKLKMSIYPLLEWGEKIGSCLSQEL